MAYYVTPKRLNLVSTRSKSPYDDRLVVTAFLASVPVGPGQAPPPNTTILTGYVGFHGAGEVIEFLNEDIGWGGPPNPDATWRIPVPEDWGSEVYLSLIINNVRGAPDESWKAALLTLAAIGFVWAVGTDDLPDELIEAARQIGASYDVIKAANAAGLGKAATTVTDIIGKLFATYPNCDGSVYWGVKHVAPGAIDALLSGTDARPTPDGYFISTAEVPLPPNMTFPKIGECGAPQALAIIEVEREAAISFPPPTQITDHNAIAGAPSLGSEQFIGTFVDEKSALVPNPVPVTIRITRGDPNADFVTVTVVERSADGAHQELFSETYPNLVVNHALLTLPGPDSYARRIAGPHVLGGGGHAPDFGELNAKTSLLRLKSGDYGESYIAAWQSQTRAGNNRQTALQLHYVRKGFESLTNTSVWLSIHTPVAWETQRRRTASYPSATRCVSFPRPVACLLKWAPSPVSAPTAMLQSERAAPCKF